MGILSQKAILKRPNCSGLKKMARLRVSMTNPLPITELGYTTFLKIPSGNLLPKIRVSFDRT